MHSLRDAGADIIVCSIADRTRLEHAFQGVSTVVHAAAIVAEGGNMKLFRYHFPPKTNKTLINKPLNPKSHVNVEGTLCAAEAARSAGASTFILFSSVMVYGFDFPDGATEDAPKRWSMPFFNKFFPLFSCLMPFKGRQQPLLLNKN
jgi:nucleoside-diphosphate-sugar epimerase